MLIRLRSKEGSWRDIPPVPHWSDLAPDRESRQKANIVRPWAFIILWSKARSRSGRRDVHRLRVLRSELKAVSDRLLGRRPPVADARALADFIDAHAAFVVQKGIYEYSRARAGHYSKVLFKERQFLDALERSRWQAYPLGLAMVGELVEGVLRPLAGDDGRRQLALASLRDLVVSVFDRYPQPAALDAHTWSEARAELVRRLDLVGLHPPKRAFEICDPFVRAYFDLLPISADLRRSEFPTIHAYLKVTLCNVHDELTRRMDGPALVAALLQGRTDACAGGQAARRA